MAKKRIGDNPLDSIIPEQVETGQKESGKPEKQKASKTTNGQGGLPSTESSPTEKVKATYYLEADVEASLERAWLELRRLKGRKVSKSEIIEAAVRQVVQDLDQGGTKSRIAQALES
jgi:hypothetical protein